MPSGLVGTTSVLDLVGESSALNEWVKSFVRGVGWVILLKNSEDRLNLGKNFWVLGGKDILGNSSSDQMTIIPPGRGSTDLSGSNN